MDIVDYLALIYDLDLDDVRWRARLDTAAAHSSQRTEIAIRHHLQTAIHIRSEIQAHAPRAVPDAAPPRTVLRSLLQRVEPIAVRRADDEAPIWEGVAAGTWSIIDHHERLGRRYLVVSRTDAGARDPLRLTPMQRRALDGLSRGLGDPQIAAQLGIKLDAASALVRAVRRKLRMPSRLDLIGINPHCLRPVPLSWGSVPAALLYSSVDIAHVLPASISEAERSVLRLQIAGKSPTEIAGIRQVAYKTVTNQIAAAYSKLNVRTRGELLHHLRVSSR